MAKKVQTGLRLPIEVNEKAARAASILGISKNDFILLAVQEKLRKDKSASEADGDAGKER